MITEGSQLREAYWPADTSLPVMETTIGGVLQAAAEAAPGRTGLVFARPGDPVRRRWTFAELLTESERAACALLARFDPGERIAVWAPSCPEWLLLEFGAALAGLTLVTVNPALRPRELLHVLGNSRAAGVFLAPEYRGASLEASLEEIRPRLPALRHLVRLPEWQRFVCSAAAAVRLPPVAPGAIAQVQYTSGTTGLPKGVLLHHRGLTNAARLWACTLGARPGECWLNPNPLFHGAGSGFMTLGPLQLLGAQVLCPFDPGLMLELMETERPAIVAAAATMVELLARHPDFGRRDTSSVRVLATGAMPVSPGLVRRIESGLGARIQISYGQTETCGLTHAVRLSDPLEVRTGTVGRPLPQLEVRVADPVSGRTQPLEAAGEVLIRGYQVMAGYFEMPEATAAAIDADGWLHTGDLGSMDAQGNLRIQGRLKEMIIRGGENVFPREIEDVIASHPAVAAVAVVGLPDPVFGEQVAACVELAPGASADTAGLQALCEQNLARFKVPARWEFVAAMPRTPLGKIQKFQLQHHLLETGPGTDGGESHASVPGR
jgi:acyl-CoA synthetase (AMP-forming)/AMP-acid ligase II